MDKERLLEIICFTHAIVAAIFGIIFLFFTPLFLILTMWPTTDVTVVRLLGAAIIGFAFGSIIAWKRVDWEKVRIIIEMEMLWLTIGIIVLVFGVFTPVGYLPWITWVFIIIFVVFDIAFCYTYYLFRKS